MSYARSLCFAMNGNWILSIYVVVRSHRRRLPLGRIDVAVKRLGQCLSPSALC